MQDKVIVITGASSGIGAAFAEVAAARGAQLVLAARREAELAAVAGKLAGGPLVVPTDVTRRADVEQLRDRALERFGHIDVWINNAGRGITRLVSELSDADVDDFGANALHGGVDSRALPNAQPVGEVADVLADLVEHPRAERYSRPEYAQLVARYYTADDVASIEAGPPFTIMPRR